MGAVWHFGGLALGISQHGVPSRILGIHLFNFTGWGLGQDSHSKGIYWVLLQQLSHQVPPCLSRHRVKGLHHEPQLMLLNPIPPTKKASRPGNQTTVNVPPKNMGNGTTLEGKTSSGVGGVVIKGAGMNGSVGCRDCIGNCTGTQSLER